MLHPDPNTLMDSAMILVFSLPVIVTMLQRKNKIRPALIVGLIGYSVVAAAWLYAGMNPLLVVLSMIIVFLLLGGFGWIRRQLKER